MCSVAEIHGTKGGIGLYHVSTLRYCDLSSSPEIHETLRMTIGIVPCSVQLACGMAEHGSVSLFFSTSVCGVLVFGWALRGLLLLPRPPRPPLNLLSHTIYSRTQLTLTQLPHTQLTLTQLSLTTYSLTHTQLTLTQLPHTELTLTQLTHITSTNNFPHTIYSPRLPLPQLPHTQLTLTQLTHTQLPHTPFPHTFFFPSLTVYALRHGPFEVESYSRTSGESNHHRQSVSDTRVTPYQLSHEDDYTFLRASYAHTTSSHTTF